jgi:hypothetical protein
MENEESVDVFKKLNDSCELGTHLHAEFIEPAKEFSDYAGKQGVRNQCYLDKEIEFGKMESLTKLFEKCFGYHPRSFRAGRFSAGANTINCLERLGYIVDTSVTPHVKWKDKSREKPVNYRGAPEQPFFCNEKRWLRPKQDGKILEIPVSIISKNNFPRSGRPVWLRPVYSDLKQLIGVCDFLRAKYLKKNGLCVLNMMFHNVEVVPNKSPYSQTEEVCQEYLQMLSNFFSYCKSEGFVSKTLSEIAQVYRV